MEKANSRSVESILMICLVLGLLVGQSRATFQECYGPCVIVCLLTPPNSVSLCIPKCIADCIIPHYSQSPQDTQYFCKLGCATTLCTNFSTRDNPAEKKVGGCVDSCSKTCSRI